MALGLAGCLLLCPGGLKAQGSPITAVSAEAPTEVLAATDDSVRYALVVGTNAGGPGQSPLRYAQDDAGRVADVLTTLAGVPAERVHTLLQPTAAELDAALDRARGILQEHASRGEPSRFFFYYSGHARADALNLGDEQVPLNSLRERLLSLPSTVSVVVLDACQSGAFSRVKGAEPAADFSYNSVRRLDTEGVAVIASSSSQELSQESEELKSSYFTHHWLVALRGGGDRNRDGRVTLSEAYDYAYNRTLATTAETQIGTQHVTLETSFKGKGELDLTQPSAADARLSLPPALAGRLLVHSLPSWSPLAELEKIAGYGIELALPAGRYAATLRQPSGTYKCALVLESGKATALAPDACTRVFAPRSVVKGSLAPGVMLTREPRAAVDPRADEGFILELAYGYGSRTADDKYSARLAAFEYRRAADDDGRVSVSLGYRLHRHLALGLQYMNLDGADYVRENDDVAQRFVWDTSALGAYVQGDYPLGDLRLLDFFVRGGGGLVLTSTEFDAIEPVGAFADEGTDVQDLAADTNAVDKTQTGFFVAVGAGVHLMVHENFGFMFEARYAYAPALENALGDVHDLGGVSYQIGLRLRTWD